MIKAAIVDDDSAFLKVMSAELEKTQYFHEIETSSDPQQFLARLHQDSPDVLFLDIEMPQTDGFQIARACRELPQPPLIVYVTAQEQHMAEAFGSHVIGFLVKSKLKAQLADQIQKIIEEMARSQICVETEQGRRFVRKDSILILSCFDRRITLKLKDGGEIRLKGRVLSDAVKALDMEACLVRINRSEVVNLMNVDKIRENLIYLHDRNQPLMISKYQKAQVLRRFSDFKVRVG